MNKEDWKKILEEASKELCKSIEKFGSNEVLGLLILHAHNDAIAYDLLTKFPMVVSLREFLGTLPIVRMEEKT